jgi:hypothetical protein
LDITYFPNGIKKDPFNQTSKSYYTLSFTYKFDYDKDDVFFAYAVPYTYSDLVSDLNAIETDAKRAAFVNRKVMC